MSVPSQPATIASCPKCGGQRVGVHCSEARIRIKFSDVSGFEALVCTVCGFSEFYTEHLDMLLEAIKKHPKAFRY